MAGWYGDQALRGQGCTWDGREVRTEVARSLKFTCWAVQAWTAPETKKIMAVWIPKAIPPLPLNLLNPCTLLQRLIQPRNPTESLRVDSQVIIN